MRQDLVTLAVLIAIVPPALADAPLMPVAAPDHVVTMTTKSFGRESGTRTHTHHAGWTRIDVIERDRPSTRYFGHADSVLVHAPSVQPGDVTLFTVRRGDEPASYVNRNKFMTGETRTILGETCHVWNVLRGTNTSLALLSCVTKDGIELWRAYVGHMGEVSSGEATRIERRPVAASVVRPPVEALNLQAWNVSLDKKSTAPDGSSGDFEAVIESVDETGAPSGRVTRVVRRHLPWTSVDERRADGQRSWDVHNESSYFSLRIQFLPQIGLHSLSIGRTPPPPPEQIKAQIRAKPIEPERSETILGERCIWFDAMPGAMDAGLHECRTADGLVLKKLRFSRGSYQNFVATRLTRRPVALSEVLPPAELLSPRSWGLSD